MPKDIPILKPVGEDIICVAGKELMIVRHILLVGMGMLEACAMSKPEDRRRALQESMKDAEITIARLDPDEVFEIIAKFMPKGDKKDGT